MSLSEALVADRAGNLELAASKYEEALNSNDPPLAAFVNLILLYWQSTDPGLAAAKRLTPIFLSTAGRRLLELLPEAVRRFPNSTAASFWRKYISWTDFGGEVIDADECRRLLREDPQELIPAMQLFVCTAGREGGREAHELVQRCREQATTGAKYVQSVIESAMAGMRPNV